MATKYADVRYIEELSAADIGHGQQDLARVVNVIDQALPELAGLHGTVEWQGEGRATYDSRLRDADTLLQGLRDGFDRAARALEAYRRAVAEADALVRDGREAENALAALIADLAEGQSAAFRDADALSQWEDLRARTGPFDWLMEQGAEEEIEAVRPAAEQHYGAATGAYGGALAREREARETAASELDAAYRAVPDYEADSQAAADVIVDTPGMREEVLEAAANPYSRRPGPGILERYQVETDERGLVEYPRGRLAQLARMLGFTETSEVTATEADILDELITPNPTDLQAFMELRDEALAAPERYVPEGAVSDGHGDAFRHAYWNARMTQEYGVEWTSRFATAHEMTPENTAAHREAMDLHNNEVGRRIAEQNPDASPDELAALILEEMERGELLVIQQDGTAAYSDQVPMDGTGTAREGGLPGRPAGEFTEEEDY
ncbi:DUF6973 domain-containing protein [Allostreptomyces psammosilenae]|uniref:Uncharacterized protein YukE n=1 Tax=Allostreptomyces psammosilenae TaxID=1892865 RepID=A0A852ZTX2_9ACTN|nr:hypothetical protein [Allostreptomyces psammosilenae]NYI05769.1 uncharacterized protein YukE [Allostreptomyces psammosilenae]